MLLPHSDRRARGWSSSACSRSCRSARPRPPGSRRGTAPRRRRSCSPAPTPRSTRPSAPAAPARSSARRRSERRILGRDVRERKAVRRGALSAAKSRRGDIRRARRRRSHSCWDHLLVAPLWVAFEANLGTLLRTCDAVGACMAVPNSPHYRDALAKGDTLSRRPCIHWVPPPRERWIAAQRDAGWRIVAVELADERGRAPGGWSRRASARSCCSATNGTGCPRSRSTQPTPASRSRWSGIGASLNVAVAGSARPLPARRAGVIVRGSADGRRCRAALLCRLRPSRRRGDGRLLRAGRAISRTRCSAI